MSKYPIKKEFFPFNLFTPPISKAFLKIAVPFMKVPRFIYKDKALSVSRHEVKSYDGESIECFMFSPQEDELTPFLMNVMMARNILRKIRSVHKIRGNVGEMLYQPRRMVILSFLQQKR